MRSLPVALGLAWRSVTAHRARALATVIAVALATGVLCAVMAANSRFGKVLATPVRELAGGDIMVVPRGMEYVMMASGYPGLVRRPDWGDSVVSEHDVTAALAGMPHVGHPSPSFLVLEAFAGGRQVPVIARDWMAADQALGFSDRLTAGRYFTPDDDGRAVVLWDGGLRNPPPVGSRVTLLMPALAVSGGQLRYDFSRPVRAEVTVIGHYRLRGGLRTGSVLMPLASLRSLTGLEPGTALWVAFTIDDYNYAASVTATVRQRLPDHRVYGPRDIYGIIFSGVGQRAAEVEDPRMTVTFLGLLYVVAALMVANNVMLSAALRHRELALLRAVGARPAHIYLSVMGEGVVLGAAGAAAGFGLVTVGLLTSALVAGEGFGDLAVLSGANLLRSMTLASAAAVAGAAWPARRAASVAPMEALRYE